MTEELCRNYRDDMLSQLEGVLNRSDEAALMGHIEVCAPCRDEFECLKALHADLEDMGDAFAHNIPRVELVAGVMDAVRQAHPARHVVVSFERPAPRPRFVRAWWLGVGAAAAAVLVLWIAGYRLTREASDVPLPRMAQVQDKAHVPAATGKAAKVSKSVPPSRAKFDEIKRMLVEEPSLMPVGEVAKNGNSVEFEKVSVDEILALRRTAASDSDLESRQDARARLAALATLSEDRARAIAASADASSEAKVGAAQSLPGPDAERVLVAAVEASPDDPYLRGELAKAYEAQPDKQAEATAQLVEQSRLDPENALNQYKIASSLIRQGDTEGATAALDRARSLTTADTYSASADASQEEALEASGMSSEAAHALTALTAGTSQYNELVQLASSLLEEGKQAEAQGNVSYAKDIYESVRIMGSQVADSSALSSERMAGLDIQSSAIDSLLRLFGASGSTDEMQQLTDQINTLAQAYDEIVKLLDGLNAFFTGSVTENLLQLVSDFILQNGDLNLLDYISGFAPNRSSGSASSAATQ